MRLARIRAAVRNIRPGKDLEQRSFAHLRQANNSSLHIDIYRFCFAHQSRTISGIDSRDYDMFSSMINESSIDPANFEGVILSEAKDPYTAPNLRRGPKPFSQRSILSSLLRTTTSARQLR
jgi:hypothetical protein